MEQVPFDPDSSIFSALARVIKVWAQHLVMALSINIIDYYSSYFQQTKNKVPFDSEIDSQETPSLGIPTYIY